MFDPVTHALSAVGTRGPYAAPLVFLAGVATSVGPCVAPRFIAVAGLATGKPRSQTRALVFAFIAGLTAAYAAFGAIAALLARAAQLSGYTYAAVAVALAVGGFVTLYREHAECHRHAREQRTSLGGAVLLGASFALVISPCCAPLMLGILAYTSSVGSPAYGSALLACFALGHALPLIGIAAGANGVASMLARSGVRQAAGIISGALMIALSGYYAVLA